MKAKLTSLLVLTAAVSFSQITPSSQGNSFVKMIDRLTTQLPKNDYGLPSYDASRILVAFHGQSRGNARQAVLAKYGLREDQTALNPYFSRLIVPAGVDAIQLISRIKGEPIVRVAEPDYLVSTNLTPNDPQLNVLWGLKDTAAPDADISAEQAWDLTTGSSAVKVCVIDTGLDYTHQDLAGNSYANPGEIPGNGVDDDGNGYVDDVYGYDFVNSDGDPMDDNDHGTHCSGTIGGKGNNGIGVVGVNWNVSIFAAKFLSAGGSGSTSNAILSVDYARVRGANIMSNSWGGGGFSQLLLEAIQRAEQADILFVAAAGNSASNNDTTANYPSNYDVANVVAVASITKDDQLSSFSSYGATSVDIAAPGSDVVSTVPGNGYASFSGTSMATPHVAGAAALLKAYFPTASYSALKLRLMNGAVSTAALSGRVVSGRLNVYNSMDNDTVAPGTPSGLSMTKRGYSAFMGQITASGDDGAVGTAAAYDLRVSSSPINAGNFNAATRVSSPAPVASGQTQDISLTGLSAGKTYYIAVKALDNVGNPSGIVTAGPYTTIAPTSTDDFEGAATMTVESGPWGISSTANSGVKSWTDSPAGDYLDNIDIVLRKTAPITVTTPIALSFSTKYDLESNYDYLYTEVSTDGTNWTSLGRLNGTRSDWHTVSYSLAGYVGQTVQLRFRLDTDTSIVRDGVYIDDLTLLNYVTAPGDNFDGSATFTGDAPWATVGTRFVSPGNSWHDSPAGDYVNDLSIDLTQNGQTSLPNMINPQAQFKMWMNLENNYDYLHVLSSSDNGASWTEGAAFTGVAESWNGYTASVVSGSNIKLKFRLTTDVSVVRDGVYIDDLTFVGEPCEPIGGTVAYAGAVSWQGLANPVGKQVVIQFRSPGTQTVLYTSTVTLGAGGSYSASVPVGTYDVAYSGDRTLRRVLTNRVVGAGGLSGQNPALKTADISDDNIIDIADYSALAAAFDAVPSSGNWNAMADLNFDGIIDIADYTLLATNFDLVGDN
ncbi:MAG: S8 family serine peptidase [Chthonomonas sp.]|nr:S8 family serine peptidase [Chthonomonas sp.]